MGYALTKMLGGPSVNLDATDNSNIFFLVGIEPFLSSKAELVIIMTKLSQLLLKLGK